MTATQTITEQQVIDYLKSLDSSYELEKLVKPAFAKHGINFTTWSYEDVQYWAKEYYSKKIGKRKAMEILNNIVENHDAELGINWDVIGAWIEI